MLMVYHIIVTKVFNNNIKLTNNQLLNNKKSSLLNSNLNQRKNF